MAPQTNLGFALLTMGQWCRNHGIHECRAVLNQAASLAAGAESSELLADALEEAGMAVEVAAADAPPVPTPAPEQQPADDPAPEACPAPEVESVEEADSAPRKGKR